MQSVELAVNDMKLSAKLFTPLHFDAASEEAPAVLFIHGWMSSQDANDVLIAEVLAARGFVCLTFDLAGHGQSEGDRTTFTRQDFLADAVAAYDYLAAAPGVNTDAINVCGASLGAYLSMVLSAERPVANLCIRVPANYPEDDFATALLKDISLGAAAEWRKLPQPPTATRSLQALHNFKGQVLLVEAEKDELVPHQTVVNYRQAVRNVEQLDYVLLGDAPHVAYSVPQKQRLMNGLTTAWFSSLYDLQ